MPSLKPSFPLFHSQFARDGSSITFLYNVGLCEGGSTRAWTYQFTVDPDGTDLWRIPVVGGGRHDYGSGGKLLVCDGTGYYEVINRKEVHRLELPNSGACLCQQLSVPGVNSVRGSAIHVYYCNSPFVKLNASQVKS